VRRLSDSRVVSDDGFDSQADSQLRERRRTVTDVSGRLIRRFDLGWTSAGGSGCEKPGLQNCGEGGGLARVFLLSISWLTG